MEILAERTFQASEENLPLILAWVEEATMAKVDFPRAMKIQLAAEEAIVNVVRYAYKQGDKRDCPLVLILGQNKDEIVLIIKDKGIPFNPLQNIEADPTLALDKREIGGWGRTLITKTAFPVTYTYEMGQNVLTMTFAGGDDKVG